LFRVLRLPAFNGQLTAHRIVTSAALMQMLYVEMLPAFKTATTRPLETPPQKPSVPNGKELVALRIIATMIAICDEFEAYGYRRVGAELRHRGMVVNSKKIRRLMREHDRRPSAASGSLPRPTAPTIVRSSQTSLATGRSTAPTKSR
jgi:hypothetical protein